MTSESELIRSFVQQWGERSNGIGDDAALLDVPPGEKLVISTDASVENVHFRRANVSPAEIGYRAAAAAISDLAAMAARPLGLLFALVLPAEWRDDASAIAAGVGAAAGASKCPVIGGNISSGGELSITTTVLGATSHPLTRSGAKPGDSLYVTGSLGGPAGAVADWERGRHPEKGCRERFVKPLPRIDEALWLAKNGASSAIDISDGLAADAAHIAEASGVLVTIDVERVPFAPCTSPELALSGGEDYELLVTAPALNSDAFQRQFGIPLTRIGKIEMGAGQVKILKQGRAIAAPAGFDHLGNK